MKGMMQIPINPEGSVSLMGGAALPCALDSQRAGARLRSLATTPGRCVSRRYIHLRYFAREYSAGMTLIELMVVVAILVILAGAIIPLLTTYEAKAKITAVKASLSYVRESIVGKPDSPGWQSDVGRFPNSIAELLSASAPTGVAAFNRVTNIGWRGPYLIAQGGLYPTYQTNSSYYYSSLQSYFGTAGDPALLDPWGDPIIIQRLTVSAGSVTLIDEAGTSHGPNAISTTLPPDGDYTRLISAGPDKTLNSDWKDPGGYSRGDDIILYLNVPDPNPSN